MALIFIQPEPPTPPEPQYRTSTRLYFTNDEPPRVVEEGDPDAHTLWVGEHGLVSLADAQRYGLLAQDTPPPDETAPAIPMTVEQTETIPADGTSLGGVLPPSDEATPLPAPLPAQQGEHTEPEQMPNDTDTTAPAVGG